MSDPKAKFFAAITPNTVFHQTLVWFQEACFPEATLYVDYDPTLGFTGWLSAGGPESSDEFVLIPEGTRNALEAAAKFSKLKLTWHDELRIFEINKI